MQKIELLLPIGSKEMALAAIHNGADAVFIGVPGFNARGRSYDFSIENLQEIIGLCHLYGVKVNLAFNVVIFQNELQPVIELLHQLIPLKPDAFIVQDLGLVRLLRKIAPWQRVHASTQMTVTNFETIQWLEDLDIQRFVLGRENSISEIKEIRKKTERELEVFVHGALCVSYSGQCFTSESIGGRSANRGQCAQSCRFSYEIYVDGHRLDRGFQKYLLSPQDLCGLKEVPELLESGVNCLKVEGRLKSSEYVATSAHAYRQALDMALNGKDMVEMESEKKNMAVNYSRGFYSGWLHGVNHQKLVAGDFSSHRGYEIGRVIDLYKNKMTIELKEQGIYDSLVPGDGLFWARGEVEQGGFIYGIEKLPKLRIRVELARDMIFLGPIEDAKVYQNHDKELKKQISQKIEDKSQRRRVSLSVTLKLALGQPLTAEVSDGVNRVIGNTVSLAQRAQTKGLTEQSLREEFGALSASAFQLASLTIDREGEEPLHVPAKEVKVLRQTLVSELTEKRMNSDSAQSNSATNFMLSTSETWAWVQSEGTKVSSKNSQKPKFNILLREKKQVQDLVQAIQEGTILPRGIDSVTLDFEFGRDYEESLKNLRELGMRAGVATTRVLKPNEYRNLKALAALKPDFILVRNLGALQYFTKSNIPFTHTSNTDALISETLTTELRGDFSLNVTNHLTANYLLKKGLRTVCMSYDLSHLQVNEMLEQGPAAHCEITIYQYMPSFHMEHCVFAQTLSEGSSFRDCGKPCERHEVRLMDQFRNWHYIKADQECRNTMFNGRARSASRYVSQWIERGIGSVRFEALKENGKDLIHKIQTHMELLENKISSEELVQRLGALESYGLGEGSLARATEYQSRKKLFELSHS